MSETQSEIGSDTAVMVYATLSNASKTDTSVLMEKPKEPPPKLPGLAEELSESDDDDDDVKSKSERRSESSHSEADSHMSEEEEEVPVLSRTRPMTEQVSFPPPPVFASPPNVPSSISHDYIDAELLEKQSLLLDLQRLKMQGITLSKEWTLQDRIEDLTFEVRRHTLHMDELSNIGMMKDGLRIMCTGIEMLNNRIGLLDLDGWSTDVCKDLDKHNKQHNRIFKTNKTYSVCNKDCLGNRDK